MNDSLRRRLVELVDTLAVQRGAFTLASGRTSDYYIDMRRATLHHEAGPLIGHVMLDMLEEAGLGAGVVDAVGGLTMGADPVAAAIMHAAASRGLDIDAFVVRKEAKDHGMKHRIEGPDVEGRSVVVLEDTSTTGGSPIRALHAAREAGGARAGGRRRRGQSHRRSGAHRSGRRPLSRRTRPDGPGPGLRGRFALRAAGCSRENALKK